MITNDVCTPENQHEVLTIKEAAVLLRVNVSTLYEMCRRGDIPHGRCGNAIRFHKDALLAHLSGNGAKQDRSAN